MPISFSRFGLQCWILAGPRQRQTALVQALLDANLVHQGVAGKNPLKLIMLMLIRTLPITNYSQFLRGE